MKRWYAPPVSFSKQYVCALLSADRILCIKDGDLDLHDEDDGAPAPMIFHGCKDVYYKDLLAGKEPTSMLLSIGDICDLEEPDMGGPDEEGIGADAEEEVDVDFTVEDLLAALEDEAGEESLCPETPPIEPVPSTPLAPACELAPAPPPPSALAPLVDVKMDDAQGKYSNVFRITPRPIGFFGGFQARCVFHAKSTSTDCKKDVPMLGPKESDRVDALELLCWWCVEAPKFSRQRDHVVGVDLVLGLCPPREYIEARRILFRPEGRIRDDNDLDNLSVPMDLCPPDSWAAAATLESPLGRGRGRGAKCKAKADPAPAVAKGKAAPAAKGKARARGRGRGRGRGGDAADAPSPTKTSSSSSSSSSTSD